MADFPDGIIDFWITVPVHISIWKSVESKSNIELHIGHKFVP